MSGGTPTATAFGRSPALKSWSARAYVASVAAPVARTTSGFVILSVGRAGTQMLVSLLDDHPDVSCDGELLLEPRRRPRRLLEGRRALAAVKRRRAYGVKILSPQLAEQQGIVDPADFLAAMVGDGWKVIRVQRRNRIDQALSLIRGSTEGRFHHRLGEGTNFEPMRVEPSLVIAMAGQIEEAVAREDRTVAHLPVLDLVYEDRLLEAVAVTPTMSTIFDYLGVEDRDVHTDLVKYHPLRQADVVQNWEELSRALRETRFASDVRS